VKGGGDGGGKNNGADRGGVGGGVEVDEVEVVVGVVAEEGKVVAEGVKL